MSSSRKAKHNEALSIKKLFSIDLDLLSRIFSKVAKFLDKKELVRVKFGNV